MKCSSSVCLYHPPVWLVLGSIRELESIHLTEEKRHTHMYSGCAKLEKKTNTGNSCVLLFWKKKTSLITLTLSSAAWTHCVWDSWNLGAFESACICIIVRGNTLITDHQQRAVTQNTATSRTKHPNLCAKWKVSFCFSREPILFFDKNELLFGGKDLCNVYF